MGGGAEFEGVVRIGDKVRVYTSTCLSASDFRQLVSLDMGMLIAATPNGFLPSAERIKEAGIPIALDNGAFGAFSSGRGWDAFSFLRLINHVSKHGLAGQVEWIVAPDIVGGGLRSLEKSVHWARYFLDGWKCLLAVQNGMTRADIEPLMGEFAGLFVGGNLVWKWTTAEDWIALAHEHGKVCHIGRSGEVGDLRRAKLLGADSADSSSFVRNKAWGKVAEFVRDGEDVDMFSGAGEVDERTRVS